MESPLRSGLTERREKLRCRTFMIRRTLGQNQHGSRSRFEVVART